MASSLIFQDADRRRELDARTAHQEKPVEGVALTNTDGHHSRMIEFLNAQSAFEHYKRVLGRNGPIETRAKYYGDRLQVVHYNAHTGEFIIGAIFTKGTRRDPGSFLCLLSGAGESVKLANYPHISAGAKIPR